jgi:hypothetical protein
VKTLLVIAIRAYQLATSSAPGTCRYHPTCSGYAIQAIRTHGALKGSWLAARRIGRCHPWHEGGYDPVPTPNPSPAHGRTARS